MTLIFFKFLVFLHSFYRLFAFLSHVSSPTSPSYTLTIFYLLCSYPFLSWWFCSAFSPRLLPCLWFSLSISNVLSTRFHSFSRNWGFSALTKLVAAMFIYCNYLYLFFSFAPITEKFLIKLSISNLPQSCIFTAFGSIPQSAISFGYLYLLGKLCKVSSLFKKLTLLGSD